MSSKSTVCLNEFNQVQDQGLSITACLLSGLEVFQPTGPILERRLRVLRGFHGLHVYASEYWMEYLLSIAASRTGLDTTSLFFRRSHELSVALNSLRQDKDQELRTRLPYSRIRGLDSHPQILTAMRSIELERAREPILGNAATDGLAIITSLSTLLFNYQHTVKELLELWSHPGVTVQELERFKHDFRCSAFTCSFLSCPLASTGFESEYLRDEHEKTHSPRVSCEVPGCQWPAFPSTLALKRHLAKEHAKGGPKYTIRARKETERLSQLSASRREARHSQNPTSQNVPGPGQSKSGGFGIESPTEMRTEIAAPEYQRGEGWYAVSNPPVETKVDISLVQTLSPDSEVSCVCFSPNGLYLAVGCYGTVEVYKVAGGELAAVLTLSHPNEVEDLGVEGICFTLDSKRLVVSSWDYVIRVSKTAPRLIRPRPGFHEDLIDFYRFSTSKQRRSSLSLRGIRMLLIPLMSLHVEALLRPDLPITPFACGIFVRKMRLKQ